MLIGYARYTDTPTGRLGSQWERLRDAGCTLENFFNDAFAADGGHAGDQGWRMVLNRIFPGDVVVVCALDRLHEDPARRRERLHQLGRGGVEFRSLAEGIGSVAAAMLAVQVGAS